MRLSVAETCGKVTMTRLKKTLGTSKCRVPWDNEYVNVQQTNILYDIVECAFKNKVRRASQKRKKKVSICFIFITLNLDVVNCSLPPKLDGCNDQSTPKEHEWQGQSDQVDGSPFILSFGLIKSKIRHSIVPRTRIVCPMNS